MVSILDSVRLGLPLEQQPSAADFPDSLCDSDGFCYRVVSFTNLPFAEPRRAHGLELLALLPWKWWLVEGSIQLDASGNAVAKYLMVHDGKYHQYPTVALFVAEEPYNFDPCIHVEQTRHPRYHSFPEMRSGALYIFVSPRADERFLRRVFDIRLSCLNTIAGCKSPGDIAQAAWQDQIDDQKHRDMDVASSLRRCHD